MNKQTGEYRWTLARARPVRDDTGQIIKWFGTSTDIDEQKRTEEALRQSQAQVQTLMASNVIGIFVTEGEEIVDANETFLRMIGYSRDDLQQGLLNWMHMTPPEYMTITQQSRAQLALHEYITPYEKEYIGKDGSRLAVFVGGVVTHLDSQQMFCFVLDNSARKALEQRKDIFISMASHELRTPLKERLILACIWELSNVKVESSQMHVRVYHYPHRFGMYMGRIVTSRLSVDRDF